MHTDQVLRRQRREQINVALDQCVLGDQRERMPGFQHHFDQLAGQLELALDRLICIGVDAQRDRLRHVTGFRQFLAQQLRRIDLGEQLGLEVQARRQVQIGMRRAREAVGTPTLYVFEEKCSALRPLRRLPYRLPAEFRPLVFQPKAVKGRLAGHCDYPQT